MCCAIFTASCSEKKKELTPGERMEAEYKYDKLPDSEKSKIKFLKYEHDFGKVDSKKLQKVRFDFQNIGKSPLILHDVHGYCGCIEASFSKTPDNRSFPIISDDDRSFFAWHDGSFTETSFNTAAITMYIMEY